MAAGQPVNNYIQRTECDRNRDGLKCDLKELILQERNDRKEGEAELKTEITTGITDVKSDIKGMKAAVQTLTISIVIAVIVAIIEYAFGKL